MAGGGKCPRRRTSIRRRRGGSKLGDHGGANSDIIVKPGSHNHGDWICVRGHRIRRTGRMRVDGNGNVYVPDSEDEEPSKEVEAGNMDVTADLGGALATADGVDVATEGIPAEGVKVAAVGDATDGIKVEGTGEEMHPLVAARLKTVLAHMDPTFHDIFVSMYKLTSINIEIYSMHNKLFIFLEEMGLSFLEPMHLIIF